MWRDSLDDRLARSLPVPARRKLSAPSTRLRCCRAVSTPRLPVIASHTTAGGQMSSEAKCPFAGAAKARQNMAGGGRGNRDWWPESLDIGMLHHHSSLSNPMGESFDYAGA